jgi:hypothetical protein
VGGVEANHAAVPAQLHHRAPAEAPQHLPRQARRRRAGGRRGRPVDPHGTDPDRPLGLPEARAGGAGGHPGVARPRHARPVAVRHRLGKRREHALPRAAVHRVEHHPRLLDHRLQRAMSVRPPLRDAGERRGDEVGLHHAAPPVGQHPRPLRHAEPLPPRAIDPVDPPLHGCPPRARGVVAAHEGRRGAVVAGANLREHAPPAPLDGPHAEVFEDHWPPRHREVVGGHEGAGAAEFPAAEGAHRGGEGHPEEPVARVGVHRLDPPRHPPQHPRDARRTPVGVERLGHHVRPRRAGGGPHQRGTRSGPNHPHDPRRRRPLTLGGHAPVERVGPRIGERARVGPRATGPRPRGPQPRFVRYRTIDRRGARVLARQGGATAPQGQRDPRQRSKRPHEPSPRRHACGVTPVQRRKAR